MSLNVTSEVIVCFIIVAVSLPATIILQSRYHQKLYPHIFAVGAILYLQIIMMALQALSYLFLSTFLHQISLWIIPILVVLFVVALDLLSNETVEPIKMIIFSTLGTLFILSTFMPGSVEIYQLASGEWGVQWAGIASYFGMILNVSIYILPIYYVILIYRKAPPYLQRFVRITFIALISGMIILPFNFIFRINLWIPRFEYIVAIAVLFSALMPFMLKPELAFVLPYKLKRLMVIQTIAGIPLYSYSWTKEEDNPDEFLFSGMLHAISMMVKDSLESGEITKVIMNNGVLFIKRSEKHPVFSVLFSTNSSNSLKNALDGFAEKFYFKFSRFLEENVDLKKTFKPADKLIEEFFPFVPDFKEKREDT